MTKDVIALTPQMPDIRTILAGLYAGGPDVAINTTADGAVIQLCRPGGRPLVSIEAPILLQVRGEIRRLLGADTGAWDSPLWWTEARAVTTAPEAEPLARSFAGRLVSVLSGTTWPAGPVTTDVVPLTPGTAATPPGDTEPLGVDVFTDKAAVVIQDRPVVAMTNWLSEALRTATTSDRALQIVTPKSSRLTLPTRIALRGHPNRWVVQDPECGYYDGLSGALLQWHDGVFAPARSDSGTTPVAQAFTQISGTGERQLIVSLRTRYAPEADLMLGSALETAWQLLTGAPPAGWSTAEPVNLPWSTRQLTDLARSRAPRPTWLIAIGHPDRPAIATVQITRTTAGVEEDITLALGYDPGEIPPLDAIEGLAETLAAEHHLTSMLTSLRPATCDLTVAPRFEAPPIPVAFTLGIDTVHDIGLGHASRPPLAVQPIQLGRTRPALHYVLGDGTNAQAGTMLQQLTQHLKNAQKS
ncbi:hypothetical protein HRW12_00085 [Streptomyces lunaelactis]|uniref:DUF6177 family protein n=1 Tax=Streptomyces lunaelactis TaxID=1535768 RepID=UPI001584EDC1|nr:DUF6177 family protein [Streptomyces lunaelactis]NUK32195.1 hypothetical protein [Streptomyces lunaelactis]